MMLLEHSLVAEAEMTAMSYDHMVEDANAHDFADFF